MFVKATLLYCAMSVAVHASSTSEDDYHTEHGNRSSEGSTNNSNVVSEASSSPMHIIPSHPANNMTTTMPRSQKIMTTPVRKNLRFDIGEEIDIPTSPAVGSGLLVSPGTYSP